MVFAYKEPLVSTIKERCRVCYTCVRECPVKAIRISGGQAEVIPERCIGCGNCVRVCSQNAKRILDSTEAVFDLLNDGKPIAAVVAPSFPAEFVEMDFRQLVGMIRALGFNQVVEVAFGADLAADRYRRLLDNEKERRFISTACPAIIGFVEKYHPSLVPFLAPIVSPMIAIARALKKLHGNDLRIVFIGPCIAKKGEAVSSMLGNEIDQALTFTELRSMLEQRHIKLQDIEPSDFDPPHGGTGALFPISRGLMQAANIEEDLITGDMVSADGKSGFMEAIKEFEDGNLDARFLDILCCNGCIMGAGLSTHEPLFSRRSRISKYMKYKVRKLDRKSWREDMARFDDLDLSRQFRTNDQRVDAPSNKEIINILIRLGKLKATDELNCGACGYDTCREHAVAIFKGLAESEMCLPYTIEKLRSTVKELAVSYEKLNSAQQALVHSEKLANMGQLAAGVAHEINNPLGVVLMYAHLLADQVEKDSQTFQDLQMVVEQADRCKKIVAGLLNFARQNKVTLETSDLRDLINQVKMTVPPPEGIELVIEHSIEDPVINLDKDQIIQVLTNIMTNAYAAMPNGGKLTIATAGTETNVQISIADTGIGIPPENLSKLYSPFFTTKQIGKGTGLGLAVSYGIIKMHRGDIKVQSNSDVQKGPTGTVFTITLPRQGHA